MTATSAKSGDGQLTSRSDSVAGAYRARRGVSASGQFAGRAVVRALLKTNRTDGNLLDCAILDGSGAEIGNVVAARPPDLQAAFYDGNTIGGVSFAQVDKDTRTASGAEPDETQLVTPDYVEDESILMLVKVRGGTGLTDTATGRVVVWQEFTTGRTWAVEAEDGGGGGG